MSQSEPVQPLAEHLRAQLLTCRGQKLLQGPAQEYITCAENKNFLFQ